MKKKLSNKDLQILLPVHNEGNFILKLLSKIKKTLDKLVKFEFIIVEDGSTDSTQTILKQNLLKFKYILLSQRKRLGYSQALTKGMKKASSNYLLIMDSDGQCDSKDIIKLWKKRNKADIVAGNRVNRKDYMYRKFFSNACYLIYKILFNVPLRDPSFGFSLMNKKVYRNMRLKKNMCPVGFFWEFNAIASKKKFTFLEVNVNHKKRASGKTKIYHLWDLPKIAMQHLIGLLIVKFTRY
jgi:glycosyltransferase involved in cell wall biosynthesis